MKRALLLLALVACSNSSSTNAPAAKPAPAAPVTATPAPGGKGQVVTKRFESEALGVTKSVVVYLPAGYDASPDKRWPVFYYLHGLGGDETNWTKGGNLAEAADELGLQAIVVMPDGDDGFYADSKKPVDYDACMKDGSGLFFPQRKRGETCIRNSHYETYVTRDLVGWVDGTYRTIAAREGRAIAGLSMGGFGALTLAMRHPDMFAATASHSGVDALLYAGPWPYVSGKAELITDVSKGGADPFSAWMRGIFGGDIATWRAYDPITLVDKLAPGQLAIYLDCGTEDKFALQHGMQYLHDLLLAKTIDHAYYLGPGEHDFGFWRPRLPHSLAFLRDHTAKPR